MVEEAKEIPEGKHEAVITRIEERTEPYHYIDIFFKLDNETEIKYGAPATVSERSKLGKLLISLGAKLIPGEKIDLEKALLNKKVTLMTVNETSERGTFARIVDGSVRPIAAKIEKIYKCLNCGEDYSENQKYCKNCGRLL